MELNLTYTLNPNHLPKTLTLNPNQYYIYPIVNLQWFN